MMNSLSPEDNARWVSKSKEAEHLIHAMEDWLEERAQLESIQLIKTQKDPMKDLHLITTEKQSRLETLKKSKAILAEFMVDHMPPMTEEQRAFEIKEFIAKIKSKLS